MLYVIYTENIIKQLAKEDNILLFFKYIKIKWIQIIKLITFIIIIIIIIIGGVGLSP
jgi:hypothetical protein